MLLSRVGFQRLRRWMLDTLTETGDGLRQVGKFTSTVTDSHWSIDTFMSVSFRRVASRTSCPSSSRSGGSLSSESITTVSATLRGSPGSSRVGDTGIVGCWPPTDPRSRLVDLPAVRCVVTAVGGQQALDQGRPRSHHADHDDRRRDALPGDLGVSGEPMVDAQPGAQAVHHSPAKGHATQFVERRRGVSVEEHTERFTKAGRAEVLEPVRSAGRGQQCLWGEVVWEIHRLSGYHARAFSIVSA